MTTTDNSRSAPNKEKDDEVIAALRESIRRSFPADPYTGKVTPHDGEYDPTTKQPLFLMTISFFMRRSMAGGGRRYLLSSFAPDQTAMFCSPMKPLWPSFLPGSCLR
jgi:hypothetical protein